MVRKASSYTPRIRLTCVHDRRQFPYPAASENENGEENGEDSSTRKTKINEWSLDNPFENDMQRKSPSSSWNEKKQNRWLSTKRYVPKCNINAVCANCGKLGHLYRNCVLPTMSFGVICFRWVWKKDQNIRIPQYLMVQRRDSLCYVEFVRGKYDLKDVGYITRLLSNMTNEERWKIQTSSFAELWLSFWQLDKIKSVSRDYLSAKQKFEKLRAGYFVTSPSRISPPKTTPPNSHQKREYSSFRTSERNKSRRTEYERALTQQREQDANYGNVWCSFANHNHKNPNPRHSCKSYPCSLYTQIPRYITLSDLINQTAHSSFVEAEWGFPKGRRNINETDVRCALREFSEETGISLTKVHLHLCVRPFEEVFMGCNGVVYKHVYYLVQLIQNGQEDVETVDIFVKLQGHKGQSREVQCIRWFTAEQVLKKIKETNAERKDMFARVDYLINTVPTFGCWMINQSQPRLCGNKSEDVGHKKDEKEDCDEADEVGEAGEAHYSFSVSNN